MEGAYGLAIICKYVDDHHTFGVLLQYSKTFPRSKLPVLLLFSYDRNAFLVSNFHKFEQGVGLLTLSQ